MRRRLPLLFILIATVCVLISPITNAKAQITEFTATPSCTSIEVSMDFGNPQRLYWSSLWAMSDSILRESAQIIPDYYFRVVGGGYDSGILFFSSVDNFGIVSMTIPVPGNGTYDVVLFVSDGYTTFELSRQTVVVNCGSVSACGTTYPILGLVRIPSPVEARWAPEKDAARCSDNSKIILPLDFNKDGQDTYLVLEQRTVNGVKWLGLYIGGCSPVWVKLSEVQLLRALAD